MEAVVEEEGGKVKVEEEAGGMESREGGNAGNCQGKGERTFFQHGGRLETSRSRGIGGGTNQRPQFPCTFCGLFVLSPSGVLREKPEE